jgi:hypothetical protein
MSDDLVKRLREAAKGLRSFYMVGAVELIPAGTMDEAADRIEELQAKLTKAVEALTPSGDTKAAYIAEVETDCPCGRPHTVSWTATKDIMKMIRERAELKGKTDGR